MGAGVAIRTRSGCAVGEGAGNPREAVAGIQRLRRVISVTSDGQLNRTAEECMPSPRLT